MSKDWKGFAPQPPQIPSVHVDRFGHLIEAGHLVLYHPPQDLILEVVDVTPVLNPAANGGRAMQTTLQARFKIQALAGVPDPMCIIVGESAERKAAKAATNGNGEATKTEAPRPRPSGLVLTDGPADQPVDEPTQAQQDAFDRRSQPVTLSVLCDACGAESENGAVGVTCTDCGTGTYRKNE